VSPCKDRLFQVSLLIVQMWLTNANLISTLFHNSCVVSGQLPFECLSLHSALELILKRSGKSNMILLIDEVITNSKKRKQFVTSVTTA